MASSAIQRFDMASQEVKYLSFGTELSLSLVEDFFEDSPADNPFTMKSFTLKISGVHHLVTASVLKSPVTSDDTEPQAFASIQYGVVGASAPGAPKLRDEVTRVFHSVREQNFFICRAVFILNDDSEFLSFTERLQSALPDGVEFKSRFNITSLRAVSVDQSGVEFRLGIDDDSGNTSVDLKFFQKELPSKAPITALYKSAITVLGDVHSTLPATSMEDHQ